MKKILSLCVIAFLSWVFTLNTAEAQVKNNVVKVNLFGMIAGQYQLAYERSINENMSVQLAAGIISRDWEIAIGSTDQTQEDNGFIIIPEWRYYFSTAPKGAYAGAFFRYRTVTNKIEYTTLDQNLNEVDATLEATRSAIGGGLLIGYQVLISDAVGIDIQLGPQYKAVTLDYKDTDPNSGVTFEGEDDGIGVRFAINFGIAF